MGLIRNIFWIDLFVKRCGVLAPRAALASQPRISASLHNKTAQGYLLPQFHRRLQL